MGKHGTAPAHVTVTSRQVILVAPALVATFLLTVGLIRLRATNLVVVEEVSSYAVAGLLAIACWMAGALLVRNRETPADPVAWFTGLFVTHVLVAYFFAHFFQFDDEHGSFLWGAYQSGLHTQIVEKYGYQSFVALLYEAFGPNILLPRVFNSLIVSIIPFLCYDIARSLGVQRQRSMYTFLAVGFLPPLLTYGAANIKEALTTLLFVLAFWIIARRLAMTFKAAALGLVFFFIWWVQGALWIVLLAPFILLSLLLREAEDRPGRTKWAVSGIVLAGFGALLVAWALQSHITGMIDRFNTPFFTDAFTSSSATVTRYVDAGDLLSPSTLSVILLRGLYSPGLLRGIYDPLPEVFVVELPFMIAWYITTPYSVSATIQGRRSPFVLAMAGVTVVIVLTTIFGVLVGSHLFRHRTWVFPFMFILAFSLSSRQRRSRVHKTIMVTWWAGAIAFAGIYVIARSAGL